MTLYPDQMVAYALVILAFGLAASISRGSLPKVRRSPRRKPTRKHSPSEPS